ncbi:MAG: enoyl-CoA hydratase [Candidatus Binatia bacterium]|nr:MAG: enoyl-CoA hydratase [Candidatus Binatia bacterium]
MYRHIVLEQQGPVATLRLARPETRNSMTPEMGDEVERACRELASDTEIRVVVLTGTGSAFSSGGDLSMLAKDAGLTDRGEMTMIDAPRSFYEKFLAVRRLPVPTIAAMNGHAIGAGFCLALACDLRVAVRDAKMGMTFVKLGLHPGMGATYFLPRLVGVAQACELFFTGRVIDAVEAERRGIVNTAVPREEFEERVSALAREIAGGAPLVLRSLKTAIYRGAERTLDEMLEDEAVNQSRTFRTEDAREGIRAVLEKREPRFRGR